jgi:hypothetical protein
MCRRRVLVESRRALLAAVVAAPGAPCVGAGHDADGARAAVPAVPHADAGLDPRRGAADAALRGRATTEGPYRMVDQYRNESAARLAALQGRSLRRR